MLTFPGNDSVWRYKCFSGRSILNGCYKESLVISAIPIQCSPAVKEIVQGLKVVFLANEFYITRILFASTNITFVILVKLSANVRSVFGYSLKCCGVYVQMYWLLVEKEYIIVFAYIFSAITYHTIWITSTKWVAC